MAAAGCRIKRKKLEEYLQDVDDFENPKIAHEQYMTPAYLAASELFVAQTSFGDIEDKSVADLGCGTGMLSIACAMLGAGHVTGFEIDADPLHRFRQNIDDFELDVPIDLVQLDLTQLAALDHNPLHKCFDTVVLNPPFGVNKDKGLDMLFLRLALDMARTAVYSLHKTSTRQYILQKARDWGVHGECLHQQVYELKATYKFHKKPVRNIDVDFFRFSFGRR